MYEDNKPAYPDEVCDCIGSCDCLPTKKSFKEACQPLVDYLNKYYHLHTTVIVTQEFAEVVEGILCAEFNLVD